MSDIKLSWFNRTDIVVDMTVHSLENGFRTRKDLVNVKCVAANSVIKNASLEYLEKCYDLLCKIIRGTLQDMDFTNGDQERNKLQNKLF